MKRNRTPLAFGLILLLALVLAACAPQAAPGPVTFNLTGLVDNPLALTDADLHGMNVVSATLEHPKDGPIEYSGVLLSDLLTDAGVQDGATTLTFTASDGYSYDAALSDVQACADCMITFAGEAGNYLSAMPGMAGKAWVKALVSIEVN